MRIDKFIPFRPSQGPSRTGSVYESFSTEQGFDIFLTEGSVFVCKDSYVAVYGPQGTAFVGEESGRPIVEGFNKRWPREPKNVSKR